MSASPSRPLSKLAVVAGFFLACTIGGRAYSASLGLDADECAIQYALLGKTAPGCPPPAPPPPPPVVYQPPEPPLPVPPPAIMTPTPPKLPGTPAPLTADVTQEVEERKASFLILFELGSAKISPASEALLNKIAAVMASPQAADTRFRIVGHTDKLGNPAKNLILSRARADAVMRHLIDKGKIPASRLESVGLGDAYLADSQNPRAATNRRVEIIKLIKASAR